MSFKIEIYNPSINRVILDEHNPIYAVPPIRVTGWRNWKLGGRSLQSFDLMTQYPMTGSMPPLLFIDVNYVPQHGSDSSSADWISRLFYTPIGVPGNWSGIHVYTQATGDYVRGKGYPLLTRNISSFFAVVGYGVEPTPGEFGVWIRDANGKIVFNSNSNTAVALASDSRWDYQGRSGGGTERYGYKETWRSKTSAPAGATHCLVVPTTRYRRYNNQGAHVMMRDYRGSPVRNVICGRSGAPVHTPLVWIKPFKPLERW